MADLELEQFYYDALREGMDFGYDLTGNEGPDELPPDVEASLRKQAIAQANQLQFKVIGGTEAKLRATQYLNEWMAQPDGPLRVADLMELIQPDFGAMRALRIARTETAWAMNTAAAAGARADGVEQVTWLAALDACDDCTELDGKVMSMDEYTANSVQHPNCRCSFQPYDSEIDGPAEDAGDAGTDDPAGDLERPELEAPPPPAPEPEAAPPQLPARPPHRNDAELQAMRDEWRGKPAPRDVARKYVKLRGQKMLDEDGVVVLHKKIRPDYGGYYAPVERTLYINNIYQWPLEKYEGIIQHEGFHSRLDNMMNNPVKGPPGGFGRNEHGMFTTDKYYRERFTGENLTNALGEKYGPYFEWGSDEWNRMAKVPGTSEYARAWQPGGEHYEEMKRKVGHRYAGHCSVNENLAEVANDLALNESLVARGFSPKPIPQEWLDFYNEFEPLTRQSTQLHPILSNPKKPKKRIKW